MTCLGAVPPLRAFRHRIELEMLFMNFHTPLRNKQQFLLKIIEISCQTKLVKKPNVLPHNLIHFVEWVWKNHKDLITTPVLEPLVSSICPTAPTEYDVELKKKDIRFLWNLLKRIGHNQTGLLNTRVLNQLIGFFRHIRRNEGKDVLEVFDKFEVFQCVPNQDTYYLTLQTICDCESSSDTQHVERLQKTAASICQKMVRDLETLLPDDGEILGCCLNRFSDNNMIKEVYALYLAAKEKRKRIPNWSLGLDMLLPSSMIATLCSRKETVHLALEMLTDKDIPGENRAKLELCEKVVRYLCPGKYLDEAKQLIFKMIADGPLPHPSEPIFDRIIRAYVQAREFRQALEMLMLLESIGLYTCDTLLYDFSNSSCINISEKILEEAKKKDSKLIIALLYHTLIFRYCDGRVYEDAVRLYTQMRDFGVALKFMTEMKDFDFSFNLDEYHKLLHSLYLKAMDRILMTEQLEEMEPMDREMAKDQLVKMSSMDSRTIKEKLEEMNLYIRASFSWEV